MIALLALALVPALTMGCDDGLPFGDCTEPFDAHVPGDSPFIHQQGTRIVDASGQAVVLKAVNLGGWLHWESWMFGAPLDLADLSKGSEKALLARVTELYGAAATERFEAAIHERFATEADFQQIAALGFDAVRLPINHSIVDSEAGLGHLDDAVRWAGNHGLTVIIDMHAAPGGQSELFMADPDPVLLWDDPAAQDELVADWVSLASRYRSEPAVAGYDLLNEPIPSDAADLFSLYDRLIPAVRAADPDHMLFIEGPDISRDFDGFTTRLDDNMAYSPHVYLWVGYPDQAWLDSLSTLSTCHDTPVWVGEFGEDAIGDVEKLRVGFDQLGGWAIWPWKKAIVDGQPGVAIIDAPADWQSLIVSLNDPPGAPAVMDEAAAFVALDGFLTAAASPRIDPAFVAALGL